MTDLNYHTAYPRLAVNYFRKKTHHRCDLQNTVVILLIQSIICNYLLQLHHPFDIEHFMRKKNILQSFILDFFKKKKNSP